MKLDYDALAALTAVLRSGSFDGAAAALGLTQPAVSLRIKSLEDRVGTVLITRARPCIATPAGARLLRHAEEVGLLEKSLMRDLGGLVADPARRCGWRSTPTAWPSGCCPRWPRSGGCFMT